MSGHSDKELTCADCRGKFVWSARERELYAEKGYVPPTRCKTCMQTKRLGLRNLGGKR